MFTENNRKRMMTETHRIYPIQGSMGSCIIFNMKVFKNNGVKTRIGTDVDLVKIEETFTKFGYDIYTVENPSTVDIEKKMKEVLAKDHTGSSSFICFILSHGSTENKISTYDGHMYLNEIIKMTDVPALLGKPKIFVIQACRGGNTDRGIDVEKDVDMDTSPIKIDDMMLVPRQPDLLLIYATPPGYVSSRNPNFGSVFIQMFCNIIEQESDKATICILLQRLTMAVSNRPFKVKDMEGLFMQVPYFMSTLRKSLMLHNSTYAGNVKFMTTSTIKDTQAEVSRRRNKLITNTIDKGQDPYHAYTFLLKETHGCYDVSVSTARHCFVIDKITEINKRNAETDRDNIQKTMTALKFKVFECNGNGNWEDTLKECTAHENIGCLFCFIQIDADNDTSDNNKLVAEVIESVKRERCMLNKPKVYIIQPYQTAAVYESDDTLGDTQITHPVKHSKESDVLIINVLPVTWGKKSFIEIFCDEYVEKAEQVPMMGIIERVLPEKYEKDWISLVPVVCSTMRKHLMMKDNFSYATYQQEYVKPVEALFDLVD